MPWASLQRGAIVCWLAFVVAGCAAPPQEDDTGGYRSVWADLFPRSLRQEVGSGGPYADFIAAAAVEDAADPRQAWRDFLRRHSPPDGDYEDATHARLVGWARLELDRAASLVAGDEAGAEGVAQRLRALARKIEQGD